MLWLTGYIYIGIWDIQLSAPSLRKNTEKQRATQRKRWATEKEKFQLKKKKREWGFQDCFVVASGDICPWNICPWEMKERESLPWKGVGSELIKR